MKKLYSSPLRVYLCLAVLALAGIISGLRLPVSLFPNSSKPQIASRISYGNSTADEFLHSYGNSLESQLRAISIDQLEVETLTASYDSDSVTYRVQFKWGGAPKQALREVESVVNSFAARFPRDVRDSVRVWTNNDNSGFLGVSFFSPTRSLDDLYNILEPVLVPKISKVEDASEPGLWNPTKKEIRVELIPETMASLGLVPRDIETALNTVLSGYSGGALTVGTRQLTVQLPRAADALDDLGRAPVNTPSGRLVHLRDVAHIDYGPRTSNSRSFKTSGAPSIILFADPRPGGNIKRMAESILEIVAQTMPSLPKDIQYRVLVDPSEFIRASVKNVFHEVLVGALLAVAVLFLFIGSFRNTVTAAIEIPLSMVLAFILMKISGMNLNLISLGGLALAAGMNVDASVVVMENIFRHFESVRGPLDFGRRLEIICEAVAEVRFAVIASTISSLVVFLPLAFTSDLSYAILGDLAKTVVFSHGFSALVALVLVPTVRLQLMSRGGDTHPISPIEPLIRKIENGYAYALGIFLKNARIRAITFGSIAIGLAILFIGVLPRLPREIIGRPDTDWMMLGVNTKGNTLVRQMEGQADEIEAKLLAKFGSKILYTFNQIQSPNRAFLMARLKNKGDMKDVWKAMEAEFANTPLVNYWVAPWNPAELPIPDPPQMQIEIRGSDLRARARVASEIQNLLQDRKVFPRISSTPESERQENIMIRPNLEQWSNLWDRGSKLVPSDLADIARVATNGRKAGELAIDSHMTDITLSYPQSAVSTVEELGALPIGIGSKLVPLKALARVGIEEVDPTIYREDERELFKITGRQNEEHKSEGTASLKTAQELVAKWQSTRKDPSGPIVTFEDAEKDLHDALKQLGVAVGLSIVLIFITLVIQFGDVVNAVLVLVAVPLGFIGVLLALFVFRSTLSLNSILGVILLNGIAVANSIILVDFLKQLVDRGEKPFQAAIEAGRKRLRPILITSLTTVLGMLPIALGLGEGGRILQPLGIAVSGGLWFSMALTLFVVPALQVAYLDKKQTRMKMRTQSQVLAESIAALNRSSIVGDGEHTQTILNRSPKADSSKARLRELIAKMGPRPSRSGKELQ